MRLAMGSRLYRAAVRFDDRQAVLICSVGCDELRLKLLSPGRGEPGIREASLLRRFGRRFCQVSLKNPWSYRLMLLKSVKSVKIIGW